MNAVVCNLSAQSGGGAGLKKGTSIVALRRTIADLPAMVSNLCTWSYAGHTRESAPRANIAENCSDEGETAPKGHDVPSRLRAELQLPHVSTRSACSKIKRTTTATLEADEGPPRLRGQRTFISTVAETSSSKDRRCCCAEAACRGQNLASSTRGLVASHTHRCASDRAGKRVLMASFMLSSNLSSHPLREQCITRNPGDLKPGSERGHASAAPPRALPSVPSYLNRLLKAELTLDTAGDDEGAASAAVQARAKSAMRSVWSSIPTDSLTVPSEMPAASSCVAVMPTCVVCIGRVMSDSTPPKLQR